MRKKAIGIDLGTTNSVMAVVREDVPEIIPMGTNDDQSYVQRFTSQILVAKTMYLLVKKPSSVGQKSEVQKILNLTLNVILGVQLPVIHQTTHVSILLFFLPWF